MDEFIVAIIAIIGSMVLSAALVTLLVVSAGAIAVGIFDLYELFVSGGNDGY